MDKDRLSSLPVPILCHILSLTPTKYAARTSVLSKRWKHRFLFVPNIIVDKPVPFLHNDFINFVNRRLMLGKTSAITEFRLKCGKFPELPGIELWIFILLSGNLLVLDIEQPLDYYSDHDSPLLSPPTEIFRSDTLVVLKLSGLDIVLKIPERVYLPKLKVLHLKDLAMQIESDNLRFAEGYPLLQDLRLEGTRVRTWKDIATLVISIKTLRNLAISYVGPWNIDIDTPHLQHLICKGDSYSGLFRKAKLRRCDSMVSADLYVPLPFSYNGGCFVGFVKLLNMVKNVKELSFSTDILKMLKQHNIHLVPQFPNLTNLDLTASGEALRDLLQRAPILKALVYEMDPVGDFLIPESEPTCLGNSLKEIRIRSFKGNEEDCAVVRYLMEHAAVLEKMTVELRRSAISCFEAVTGAKTPLSELSD